MQVPRHRISHQKFWSAFLHIGQTLLFNCLFWFKVVGFCPDPLFLQSALSAFALFFELCNEDALFFFDDVVALIVNGEVG